MARERPILFKDRLVRAVLEGRKTQTRRPVKFIPVLGQPRAWCHRVGEPEFTRIIGDFRHYSPFGVVGDRLYVREAHAIIPWVDEDGTESDKVLYRADDPCPGPHIWDPESDRWRPSIHMHKRHSRLLLKITGIRVERVQAISEEDALAEGLTGHDPEPADEGGTIYSWLGRSSAPCPRAHFAANWGDHYSGEQGWEANPWVWVIDFEVVNRG